MKPIMILPPNAMSKADIDLLNANGLCVVIAEDPALVKFVDPLPAQSSRNEIEHAAIQLSRRLLSGTHNQGECLGRRDIALLFAHILMQGSSLNAVPTQAERVENPAPIEHRAERMPAKKAKQAEKT